MELNYSKMGPIISLRSGMEYRELEKRQVFLRSYQFSRKQSLSEKIKKSFFRVKRVLWGRFRSARKMRKIVWLKLKNGVFFSYRRRRFFFRLHNSARTTCSQSSCFW